MADFTETSGRQAERHDGTNGRAVPGESASPRGLRSSNHRQRKKLVLHMDVNNTVVVSDTVTGQGTVAALDGFLTTSTWGKMTRHGKWEWLSDSPSLLPPCKDAVRYSVQFGRIPGFTSGAGRRFRGVLDEHLDQLRWPEGVEASIHAGERDDDNLLIY